MSFDEIPGRARTLRRAPLLAMACGVGLSFGACKKDDEASGVKLGPAELAFIDAQNTDGDVFEAGSGPISLACDDRLTFRLGPQTGTRGLLDNWYMRPPGNCGELTQCGFIELLLLDEAGDAVASFHSANASTVVDLASLDISEVTEIRATLLKGQDGEPYLQDEEVVTASWKTTIERAPCDGNGLGGEGGMGGSTTGMGGAPGTGGTLLGGLGGLMGE